MAKKYSIIHQCYINLTTAVAKYQDNWISDKTWFRVTSSRYPDVIKSIRFSCAAFNHAISGHANQCGSLNESGIFMHQFLMPCPYERQQRKVSFYYRQVAGKPPAASLGPFDCEDVHVRVMPIRLSTAE
jgi:hypothetical protein